MEVPVRLLFYGTDWTRQLKQEVKVRPLRSHPEDEADGGHSRRGHDFGAVGHEVEQDGHDALCSVVKLVPED